MEKNSSYPQIHSFHIPVMGTGFSIDTPIKVARYGISSVISLVDDTLIEEMRQFHAQKSGEPFEPITKYEEDYRARRITAYLNLVDRIVKKQISELKKTHFEIGSEITKYFELLSDKSPLKTLYNKMLKTSNLREKEKLQEELRSAVIPGDINVNIMTKLDRENYAPNGDLLPSHFSDALAALRGYAQSTLQSAIIFSAGINQRLYGYTEEFKDFFADAKGFIKKRIVIKVSDYRSCFVQGKFFAKKGLWVSEYRIESGLNCGGHAFATVGLLMGPILEEIKNKRQELIDTLHQIYNQARGLKGQPAFAQPHEVMVTAQGGIGTAREDQFLLDHYNVNATGWGTPFLLCPEATNVDEPTLKKLAAAQEKDLYLSEVSPLGVPFNNLRDCASDLERDRRSAAGRPGSPCPKGHLVSNTEFTEKPICTASRLYQKLKIESLEKLNLPELDYSRKVEMVTRKSCICNDLGEGALIKNQIPKNGTHFSAVCPGPNLAYFSRIVTLKEMVGHIYGRLSILNATYRSHMFVKELKLYIDYLKNEVMKNSTEFSSRQNKHWQEFHSNLESGIQYYRELFPKLLAQSESYRQKALYELHLLHQQLENFVNEHRSIFFPELVEATS